MNNSILSCRNLSKTFINNSQEQLTILHDINLDIRPCETLSIVGSSGSGKTSLLQILAGLDQASQGEVVIYENNLTTLTDNQLCQLRNKHLGFIYQFHHLLAEFTALENTLMPSLIANQERTEYAKYILDRLKLSARLEHYPNQLSGGERQRVAIARAVINQPQLIFADEPTGNLDNHTANQVLEMFFDLQQELKTSLIIVTHDQQIARNTHRRYTLRNGQLSSELPD